MAHMNGVKKVQFAGRRVYSLPMARSGHNAIFMWDFFGDRESAKLSEAVGYG